VRDLGRYKVDAVADVIQEHLLQSKTFKYHNDIAYAADKFRDVVKEVDLVICATDNKQSRALVNHVCVSLNKPVVLVCTFDNAKIGEIIQVRPHVTACYECSRLHLIEKEALLDEKDSSIRVPYTPQAHDLSGQNSRGTRTDVYIVAAMATKVSLMMLKNTQPLVFGNMPYGYIT